MDDATPPLETDPVLDALAVPTVWTAEERESLTAAFDHAQARHGYYETMFAVAAESLRLARKRYLAKAKVDE